jgi:hypothetical protein
MRSGTTRHRGSEDGTFLPAGDASCRRGGRSLSAFRSKRPEPAGAAAELLGDVSAARIDDPANSAELLRTMLASFDPEFFTREFLHFTLDAAQGRVFEKSVPHRGVAVNCNGSEANRRFWRCVVGDATGGRRVMMSLRRECVRGDSAKSGRIPWCFGRSDGWRWSQSRGARAAE